MGDEYNVEIIADCLRSNIVERVFINNIPQDERANFMRSLLNSAYFNGRVGNENAWRDEISHKDESLYCKAHIASINIEKRGYDDKLSFFWDGFNRGKDEYMARTFNFEELICNNVVINCNIGDIGSFLEV